jgi:hypothetical protein
MPVAVSRKQYRMMQCILHGKGGDGAHHPRGRPPASIAAKYTSPGKDAPESKDNDHGGTWTEEHHRAHAKGKPHKKDKKDKKLGKSLFELLEQEALEKAEHDAVRLVGIGVYRHLKKAVAGMGDESFKEIDFDTYKVSIRRHTNDTYSGNVEDGHKVIYQYTQKTLHELAAALMSLFEWYLPEDAKVLDIVSDEGVSDDAIHGGLSALVDNYKRHNLGEIYQEMETIRENIRNGTAIDLQQVEAKILKLFDRLEQTTLDIADKHNQLAQEVSDDLDELETKLRDLQNRLDNSGKGGKTIEAFSSNPADGAKVHGRLYSYLTKPRVEIHPTGKIIIAFGDDWDDLEQSSFLEDMRAKVKSRK